MKLVVGLGNPGIEYENTRHNIGFLFLDYLFNCDFKINKKFNSMEYITIINGEKVILVKPLSYMNLSGEVVLNYVKYYKINYDDILIIQDDLDMDIGKHKLIFNHGDGGHNGIKNIFLNLSSHEILRLKFGISKSSDVLNYVLGNFSKEEFNILFNSFKLLNNIICDFVLMDRDLLISKYNSMK